MDPSSLLRIILGFSARLDGLLHDWKTLLRRLHGTIGTIT